MSTELAAAVAAAAAMLGPAAVASAPLGLRTTYRVGGSAALGVEPSTEEDLLGVGAAARATGLPLLIVGRGSNLLVADAGFPGIAVFLGDAFADIDIEGSTITAGGGASLPVVARRSAAAGLTGFEWAVGVPGSIGGAVRMNAGGHGSDMRGVVEGVRVVQLEVGAASWWEPSRLDFGYRRSSLGWTDVVVAARLACAAGDRVGSDARINDIVRWRRAHQPGGQNAGSVFTNPDGDHAGRLVEAAGAKGLRRGSAAVSDKHANFIQADEGGSADDVKALMDEVRRRVAEHSGVVLRTEIRLIGFQGTYPFPDA